MIDDGLIDDLRRSFAAALEHDEPAKARRELLDAGWLDALDADEAVAVALVFRLQGSSRHDAAALDDVIGSHLGLGHDVAVVYAVGSAHVVLAARRDCRRLLWLDDGLEVIELEKELSGVVAGVDPGYGLLSVVERPSGSASRVDANWSRALTAGRVAIAHQMNAASLALVGMATEYARARRQFGTAIGSFQAVKHQLAETLVAVSSADAAAVAAASAPTPLAGAVAKALAGRAAATAAKHCLQVFGGIGVTSEHEFHRYFRRNLVLDRLLGDHESIERQLGEQVRTRVLRANRVIQLDDQPRVELLGAPPT